MACGENVPIKPRGATAVGELRPPVRDRMPAARAIGRPRFASITSPPDRLQPHRAFRRLTPTTLRALTFWILGIARAKDHDAIASTILSVAPPGSRLLALCSLALPRRRDQIHRVRSG